MSLVSGSHFGNFSKQEDYKVDNEFKTNNFDSTLMNKNRISGLVMFEVINNKFNMRKLLIGAGLNPDLQNMYCPFHDDLLTGKPSAKYHPDTDRMYCFSESKMYTAYHALKYLYRKDMRKVFSQVWSMMSKDERQNILDKYDESGSLDSDSSIWENYKNMFSEFKNGRINYGQVKNGIYKVMLMDSDVDKEDN